MRKNVRFAEKGGINVGFRAITPAQLWKMVNEPDVYVIDLRDRSDYRRSHLRGARSYPYDEMSRWECSLPRGRKLILCCEYGNTSMYAAKRLAAKGYQVYTLIGGLNALND